MSNFKSLLSGSENPLWEIFCNGYAVMNKKSKIMSEFCNAHISRTKKPGYNYKIILQLHERGHCGYCSDNNESYDVVNDEKIKLYMNMPEGYDLDTVPALYEEFCAYICYCRGQEEIYTVLMIKKL